MSWSRFEAAAAVVYLLAWLALFVAGLLVNSEPLRTELVTVSPVEDPSRFLTLFGATVGTYTITNICLLAICASLIGDIAARVGISSDETEGLAPKDDTHPRTSALLRGFFVYLAFLAGVVVISDNPLNPSQDQYWRIGGALSLTAFVTSVRPGTVADLLKRARGERLTPRPNGAGAAAGSGSASGGGAPPPPKTP